MRPASAHRATNGTLSIRCPGRMAYGEAFALQEELRDACLLGQGAGSAPNVPPRLACRGRVAVSTAMV